MRIRNKISRMFLIAGFVLPYSAHSQITLTGNDYLSKPAGVISDIIKVEGITSPSQVSGVSANNKVRTYKYLDGFGRSLQDVVEGGSPDAKDVIQLYKYDEFGRSTKNYLPFVHTSVTSGQPYQDRSTALSNQASFYTTNTTANKIANDSKPWVQADVEQSPMQRLLKQGNVGDGFQTDQHYKSGSYRVTDANDGVRKWAADGTSSGTYSANDLSVTEGTNENGVKGMVFTDKLGRTVLKRQQADETIGGTTYTYFDTYYVYDLLGNVAFVIPPKAVVKLTSVGGTWNVTSVPNLIFSYKYDNKNRVTEKKVPGADAVYMVYDPLDRVVLAQSGTMRTSNTWFYSKYDANGRVVTEGVYTDNTNTTLAGMQGYVNGLSCYSSSSTTYYEEKTNSTSSFYTNNCFPTGGTEERLYYYYDNYDMDEDGNADYSYTAQSLPDEGTATDKTAGLPTIVNKKILGISNWLISATFYDKHYNVIQVTGNNQLGQVVGFASKSMATNVIDFGGRLNERKEYHSFSKTISLTIRNTYSYDKMNRLTELKQGHNGGTMIIVGRYEYNSLGQLVDKKLHSTNSGSSFLQSVDFRYNIRGQLTSINNSTLSNDNGATNDESNDVWGMSLFYEKEDNTSDVTINNTPNWTGMLSAIKWKANVSGGNNDERAYLFNYDKLYRLSAASYKAKTGSTWTKDVDGFNETIGYDWNGNILTMKRKAVISGSVTDIDDMVYGYSTSNDNNKLENMAESSSNSYGYRNFTNSNSGYSYDVNGNLTTDAKKGTTITYNELNKPVKIEKSSTQYVEFSYDAAGVRLSKKIVDGSNNSTDYYIAGAVVQSNSTLKYFAMAEGRVRNNSGTLIYEYFITDQQGNVRVSFEDNGSGTAVVRQENSYYTYGMPMIGNYMLGDPNKKLYNAGSEWQDEFGGVIDYYSTFFREYDPVIGRFNGVDPKAEATLSLSIYHYAGNNPVNFNDPMGDISGSEFEQIVNQLLSSKYGGTWSSNTNITAYFGDEFTATLMGSMNAIGFSLLIEADGVYSLHHSSGTVTEIIEKYTTVYYKGDRDFGITYGRNSKNIMSDIDKIVSTSSGAFLLSIISVLQYKVTINAIPGYQDMDPQGSAAEPVFVNAKGLMLISSTIISYDALTWNDQNGLKFQSHITLSHELFHVLDQHSFYNGSQNFYWPFEFGSVYYNTHVFSGGMKDDANFPRTYFETRAVLFENQIRSYYGQSLRYWYGNFNLTAPINALTQHLQNHRYF